MTNAGRRRGSPACPEHSAGEATDSVAHPAKDPSKFGGGLVFYTVRYRLYRGRWLERKHDLEAPAEIYEM